jgi:tetratricopeptide (TPR) repeat protein
LAVLVVAPLSSALAQNDSPAQRSAAATALREQAVALHKAGRFAEAEAAYATALKAAEQLRGERDASAIVKVLGWHANLYRQQGRFAESWRAAERALPLHEAAFGPDDPHTAYLHGLLGAVGTRLGRYADAERHLRVVLEAYSRNGGSPERNEAAANAAHELGHVLLALKRPAEAVTVLQVGVGLRSSTAPRNADALARVTNTLAVAFERTDQLAEAEATYKAAVALVEGQQGPDATLVDLLFAEAVFYRNQQRLEDAWNAARRALAAYEKRSADKSQAARIRSLLGGIALLRNDKATAETEYRLALAADDSAPSATNLTYVADAASELGFILMGKANNVEAVTLLEKSIALRRQTVPVNEIGLATALQRLGLVYKAQRKYREAEQPIRQALEAFGRAMGPENAYVAYSYMVLGDLLFAAGRYAEAEGPFLSALTIRSKHDDPLGVAEVEIRLATTYRYLNRFDQSERLARRALATREARLRPDDQYVADALFNLAAAYRWMGRHAEAEPLLRRSLAIREPLLGVDNPHVLADLNSLANSLDATGRSVEAEPMIRRALAGREKVLGPDDPDVADTLVNLITLLRRQGRYAEAAAIAGRPLEIYRKALGHSHPSIVPGLRIVATIHQERAEFAKAEELFIEALKIRQAAHGVDHAYVGASYMDLVRLSLARRQIEEAEGYAAKALAIYEKWYGADDTHIVWTLRDVAKLRVFVDQLESAEALLKRALAICERVDGAEALTVAILSSDLAALNQLRGKLGDAEKYYERPLAIYRKQLGSQHPWLAYALEMRANLDVALGQPQEAERRYDEALKILLVAYGKASPVQNFILNNKALLLAQLKRLDEAERLFKQAIDLLQAGAGGDTWALAVALSNLGGLYSTLGRHDEAEALLRRAADIANRIYGPDRAPPFLPMATLPPPAQEN